MSENFALFKESYGRKIKTVVEDAEKVSARAPGRSDVRLLAGYTSPVEITSEWQHDGTAWKCWARRLFRIDGVYQPIDDGVEFELYCPTCLYEQPPQGMGDLVFAVYRGVWELVSAVGGGTGDTLAPMQITRVNPDNVYHSDSDYPQVWARQLQKRYENWNYTTFGEEIPIYDPIHILCNAKVGDYVFAVYREGRTEAIRRSEEEHE